MLLSRVNAGSYEHRWCVSKSGRSGGWGGGNAPTQVKESGTCISIYVNPSMDTARFFGISTNEFTVSYNRRFATEGDCKVQPNLDFQGEKEMIFVDVGRSM